MIPLLFALSASAQDSESLTGTWVTEAPIPYLVEYTEAHPQGDTLAHDYIKLLERSATMEWTLEQRPDGLVVGTNTWTAHDADGNTVFEGVEGLLGYFDGEGGMLGEPADESSGTAQINFEFKLEGNKIMGYAFSVGGPKLMVMRFELVRK